MKPEIRDYLKEQRVGILAVTMPDGTPHGATVHFAYNEDSFVIYIQTSRESRKAKAFMEKGTCAATFVIGSDESKMKTFQLDGELHVVSNEEKSKCEETYLGRFPEKAERAKDPRSIYIKFIPTWWRYSDMKNKVMLSSEQ